MGASGVTELAIALLALMWLGIAVAVAIGAARRLHLADQVLDAARANARLLELMPARPLLVGADGRIEADAILLRDLGLEASPKPARRSGRQRQRPRARRSRRAGSADIEAARVSAGRVVAQGAGERLWHGCSTCAAGPRRRPNRAGTMLLWFFDTSAGEEERAKLALRLRQTEGALNSLDPADRSGAVSDVVPRARPQARPGQQRLRRRGRGHATPPTSSSAAPN